MVAGFVAERVGEAFDGEAAVDAVAGQVQVAVDLDEGHGPLVAGQDRERDGPDVFALEGVGVGGFGWDGGGAVDAGAAKAADDVGGFDGGPHEGVVFGEGGAHRGELDGQRLLGGIEGGGLGEELVDLVEVRGAFGRPARPGPVAVGSCGGCGRGHGTFP